MATGRARGSLLEQLAREQVAIWRKRVETGDVLWRDKITGLIYDKGQEYNPRVVAMAIGQWALGRPVVYAEGDLANLAGLNSALAQSGADAVMAYLAGVYREEFHGLDGDTIFMRKGGDEFGLTTVGVALHNVQAAIDRARARVLPYLRQRGLDTLPHTKAGRPQGTGLRFAVVEYDPAAHRNEAGLRNEAEIRVEKMKARPVYEFR